MSLQKGSGFEWLNIDRKELEYHLIQYSEPKEYTKSLLEIFIEERLIGDGDKILDFGCGCGAVTSFLAKEYLKCNFIGLDLNQSYIDIANQYAINNTSYYQFDLYSEDSFNERKDILSHANGLLSFQTLSWLPNYCGYIDFLKKLDVKWSVVTSLFYDGYVDAEIKIKDFTRTMGEGIDFRESYYNIYSIDRFDKLLRDVGYYVEKFIPFIMPYDLPKPENKAMSTYTIKLQDNSRLQISGPLLMSWYTIIIKKIKYE